MADPYIDYSQGPYSNQGVQQFLQTMLPRWNTQWQDPNMQGGYVNPAGSAVTLGGAKGLTDKALQDFTQQVQAVTGQAPTPEQINQFFTSQLTPMASQGQPGGYDPIHPQDITSAIQQYVPTAFADQIGQHQQQSQSSALQKNIDTGQGLIDQAMGTFSKNLIDPNNPLYQQFSGQMNNMGITPSSGAFQAGLGGTLANRAADLQGTMMSTLGFPSLAGIQGLSGQANQNLQGAAPVAQQNLTTQQNSLGDFGRMQAIAQMLQNQMEPSGFDKNLGRAASAGQAAQGVGTGMAGVSQVTSYVCKELIKRDLICEQDMDDFHAHIMPAMFKKGRAFWKYAVDGWRLVNAVNIRGLDWSVFKPLLFDRVMDEKDPCKAVDLYADACHQLCISSDRSLWDERVYRTSI